MTHGLLIATGVLSAIVAAPDATIAQDGDPAPADVADEDEELEKLRAAARAEAEAFDDDDGVESSGDDDLDALRADAARETEEPSVSDRVAGAVASATTFASSQMERLNAFNPRITVFGDFLGRRALGSDELVEDGEQIDNKFRLRETEIDFRADIDPYAKGVVIVAFENETGEFEAVIEEGYATIEALPFDIPTFNARLKVGRFRTPFGQMNRLHLHDLMWSEYPLAVQDFLGEEGDVQDGVELQWLAPGVPIEITGAIVNGENATVLADGDSEDPAYIGRISTFFEISDTMWLSVGGSFLFGYNDQDREQETELYGADFMFKWAPSRYRSVVITGEGFYTDREQAGRTEQHASGGYAAIQIQPMENLYFGARYDYSDFFEQQENDQWAASAWVSFYTTEFLRLRVGVEHRERPTSGGGDPDLDTLFVQFTFVFGSHPTEPFWVNR